MFRIALLHLLIAGAISLPLSAQQENISRSLPGNRMAAVLATLPAITDFRDQPSDRFLVDLAAVRRGHPYRGRRAERPHTGGHLYFTLDTLPLEAKDIQSYPAIYAVADGVITRVDYAFRLREMFEPALKQRVANYRYGIGLAFAREGNTAITFHYSIEPFINPGDPDFYRPFLLVKPGDRVKKGDVIARMYIPNNRQLAEKSHIHFNLLRSGGGGFVAPAIFNNEIVREFHRRWNLFPNDPDAPIPPCIGFKLDADENPFQRKPVDRL